MKLFWGALLLALSTSPLLHADTAADCPTLVDGLQRFGPTRDQDGHGSCWSFAAAALMEEEYCKEKSAACGVSYSPLDDMRCGFDFNSKDAQGRNDESGDSWSALNCSLDWGICPEADAPFARSKDIIECVIQDNDPNDHHQGNCKDDALAAVYDAYKKAVSCPNITHKAATQALGDAIDKIKAYVPENIKLGADAKNALLKNTNNLGFLEDLLIPPACVKNRHAPIQGLRAQIDPLPTHAKPGTRTRLVRDQLKQGHSVILDLCVKDDGTLTTPPCKIGHALVINGMQWNPDSKTCQLHLKNSWGEGAPLNGWVAGDAVLNAGVDLTYLTAKSSP